MSPDLECKGARSPKLKPEGEKSLEELVSWSAVVRERETHRDAVRFLFHSSFSTSVIPHHHQSTEQALSIFAHPVPRSPRRRHYETLRVVRTNQDSAKSRSQPISSFVLPPCLSPASSPGNLLARLDTVLTAPTGLASAQRRTHHASTSFDRRCGGPFRPSSARRDRTASHHKTSSKDVEVRSRLSVPLRL